MDRDVSLEVTPAKLKVSGRAGPVALIKWMEFPFALHAAAAAASPLPRRAQDESGGEEYTL